MLASLIAFSALTKVQNPQFPKPAVDTPAALLDSSIFKYRTEEDKAKEFKPLVVGRDLSNLQVPAMKPDAVSVKILLTVAERDFSNPQYSNILENRDKTRIIEAMGRLKTLYTVISNGTVNVEIIPRFYPDAIFDIRDFKGLIDTEFNEGKFEADDSIERGPFAAVIAISSSHVETANDPKDFYTIKGFADLGGSSQDMWLEEGLFYLAQNSVQRRLASHFQPFGSAPVGTNEATKIADVLASLPTGSQKLFDPNYRQDAELITKWATDGLVPPVIPTMYGRTAIQSPASVEIKEGALLYTEMSLMRAGGVAFPWSSKFAGAKSLKFDIKTATTNPLAVKIWTSNREREEQYAQDADEVVLGNRPGMVPLEADNNWHTVSIDLSTNGTVVGVSIGAPRAYYGTSRLRSDLVQYQIKNVELSSEMGVKVGLPGTFFTPAKWETEETLRTVLTSGTRYEKRVALQSVDKLKGYRTLAPTLLSLTGDIDAGIATDATRAYFEVILNGQPTPEELLTLTRFLKSPPNEYSRNVALQFVGRNPAFATAGDVAASSVRPSWQTRKVAMKALGDLYRAGVREKEFCKQLILTSTAQEMATIRMAAVNELDASLPKDNERLTYLMVNDPQESIRYACLVKLAANTATPKERILGTLADDSPTLREQVPAALGASHPLLREVLQKMVVDQDPYVRISALRNLATIGNVQEGEIQNTFSDRHPAVQIALLEGAKKGAWKIPAEPLDRLKASPIKVVAKLASEVK